MTAATFGRTVPIFRERLLETLRDDPGRRWLTVSNAGGESAFTCAQLQARIADFTRFYRDRGIRRGDVVLVVLRESLDLFASFLAGIVAGALPAYFAYPSPKQTTDAFVLSIEQLLAATDIPLVVTYPDVVDVLATHRAQLGSRRGGMHDAAAVPCGNLADAVMLEGEGPEAFLQFSSGTTGAKKGVRISSRALFAQIDAYNDSVQFRSGSRVVSWLPHYHDMGLVACMLMPLLKKVPIAMLSPFEWVRNPGLLFEAATRHRATHMWLPNFALGHLTRTVTDAALAAYDLSALEHLVCCSEPVSYRTVRAFIDRFRACGLAGDVVRNCYAMAENTFAITSTAGAVTFLEVDPARLATEAAAVPRVGGKPIASAGRPLRNVELRVVDDAGSQAGERCIGEITIRTDCMLDEYHHNPAATADAVFDGWLHTGDLGFLDDGDLYITGRKKDLIIVGGENIYPQDIESILDAEAGLVPGRSVVFGMEDEQAGTERIVVLAETMSDGIAGTNRLSLQTKIFERLGVSVAEIRLLPQGTLRKSTAGKISRGVNRDAFLVGMFDKPISRPSEDLITRIVIQSLPASGTSRITGETPLLSSGLIDSLAFTALVLEIEKACDVQVPVEWQDRAHFNTVDRITNTVAALQTGAAIAGADDELTVRESRAASMAALHAAPPRRYESSAGRVGLIERLINKLPIHSSRVYGFLFRRAGITMGSNVVFLGRVRVRLAGDPARITFGDDVIVGDNVEIRNREQGRIVIGSRVRLDDDVRLVAARDGSIEIGEGTAVGRGTIVNSGGTTRIGRYAMVSSYVSINASTHGTDRRRFMPSQPFRHGIVDIGDDVWIGSGAVVVLNCHIGEGAVIQSNSMVTGQVPPFAVCGGNPAKVERYR
jgi:fatty-acyl-CoA synthase